MSDTEKFTDVLQRIETYADAMVITKSKGIGLTIEGGHVHLLESDLRKAVFVARKMYERTPRTDAPLSLASALKIAEIVQHIPHKSDHERVVAALYARIQELEDA